jgi:hypothetical protein
MRSLLLLLLEARKCLKGAFDLVFLFGRGINVFDPGVPAMMRSFWLPVLTYPLLPVYAVMYEPKGMEGFPAMQVVTTVTIHFVLSYVGFLSLAALLAKAMGVAARVPLFITASNWVGIAALAVTFPFMLAAVMGWIPREEMDRLFVIIGIYFYVVTGCVAFRALKVNWQLAGFIAIVSLLVSESVWDMLFFFQGIENPWGW